jgi:hypothetical protein
MRVGGARSAGSIWNAGERRPDKFCMNCDLNHTSVPN